MAVVLSGTWDWGTKEWEAYAIRDLSHLRERFLDWGYGDLLRMKSLKSTQMAPPVATLARLEWGGLGEILMVMLFSCSLFIKVFIPIT